MENMIEDIKIEEKEQILLKDTFIVEVDVNGLIVKKTKIIELFNGETVDDILATTYCNDGNILHVYNGAIDLTKEYIYDNGSVEIDTANENKKTYELELKNAQEYLDRTDRLIAKSYETGSVVPSEITELRTHYRTFLDGKGEFSKIILETQLKLNEIQDTEE